MPFRSQHSSVTGITAEDDAMESPRVWQQQRHGLVRGGDGHGGACGPFVVHGKRRGVVRVGDGNVVPKAVAQTSRLHGKNGCAGEGREYAVKP